MSLADSFLAGTRFAQLTQFVRTLIWPAIDRTGHPDGLETGNVSSRPSSPIHE